MYKADPGSVAISHTSQLSAMLRVLLLLVSTCYTWDTSSASYPMVLAHPRDCTTKLDHLWITVTDYGFESMYIDPDNPQPMVLGYDICLVPSDGQATQNYRPMGLATKEAAQNVDEDDMVIVQVGMSSEDCEKLTGKKNPTMMQNIQCQFYIIDQNQNNSGTSNMMLLAGSGECPMQAAPVVFPLDNFSQQQCEALGGTQSGATCQLDLCYTEPEVMTTCIPTATWDAVQTCTNMGSRTARCSIKYDEGSSGSRISEPESRELVAELRRAFRSTSSDSRATHVHWDSSVAEDSTWGRGRRRSTEINVPVGRTIRLEQLVGRCGGQSVRTKHLRAVPATSRKARIHHANSTGSLYRRWLELLST